MLEGQNSKRLQKVKKKIVRKKVVLHPCNTFLVLHGISFRIYLYFASMEEKVLSSFAHWLGIYLKNNNKKSCPDFYLKIIINHVSIKILWCVL
jgi:hypothetical protein